MAEDQKQHKANPVIVGAIITGSCGIIAAIIGAIAPIITRPQPQPPVKTLVRLELPDQSQPPPEVESPPKPSLPPKMQPPMQTSIQLPPLPSPEVVSKYPEILEYFKETDKKHEAYFQMEGLIIHLRRLDLFNEMIPFCEWLSKQADLSEKRKVQSLKDLEYARRMWVASRGFINDIQNNLVTAVITDDPAFIGDQVNVRQNPVIGDNIIDSFNFNDKVQVLQRSDSRQQIQSGNAYWYKVRADDGTEGWVYGQFLDFYLSEKRKAQRTEDLKDINGRWASDGSFNDIQNNLITAVIAEDPAFIGDQVNVRQNPVIGDNIIGSFNFNDEVQVLQRSDSRQRINGRDAYWYKVRADGIEGWVYGQFLNFTLHT